MNCEHREIERERMPHGYIHYEKIICRACRKFLGWGKNPATIQREKQNAERIQLLQAAINLNEWQREFIASIAKERKLSPRQQSKLDQVFEEKMR